MNKSLEMYLKTIYVLERDHGHAHVVDISDQLGITKPSVTKAMNKLKQYGLIEKEIYGHITLTEKGQKMSHTIYYKHAMITEYLKKSLGISQEEAATNACLMEHIITDKMLEAIENYVK